MVYLKQSAYTLFFLLLMGHVHSQTTGQVVGNLKLSKEKIQPGDQIEITYLDNSAQLKESVGYYLTAENAYPFYFNFHDRKATLSIPDSVISMAIIPAINHTYDHYDRQGYLFALHNEEGKPLPGSEMNLAYYGSLSMGENSWRRYGIQVHPTDALHLMDKTFQEYPSLKTNTWQLRYVELASKTSGPRSKQVVDSYREDLEGKQNLSENEFDLLEKIYQLAGQNKKYDSLRQMEVQLYPQGRTAAELKKQELLDLPTVKAKLEFLNQHLDLLQKAGNMDNIYLDIALHAIQEKDLNQFDVTMSNISSNITKVFALLRATSMLVEEKGYLDMAESLSTKAFDLVTQIKQNEKELLQDRRTSSYVDFLEVSLHEAYASVMSKLGNFKKAIQYQEYVLDNGVNVLGPTIKNYFDYVFEAEQYQLAEERALHYLFNGKETDWMYDFYKKAYRKNNPNKDLKIQMAEVEKRLYDKQKKELREKLINENAADFELQTLDGKPFRLSELKGNIVFLDFWATWCGPCKRTFPALQEVIDHLKETNQTNVHFLFINTFENRVGHENHRARMEAVQGFIEEKGYDFRVAFDKEVPDSDYYEVSYKYGVKGIPVLIAIDKQGNIRYQSIGYQEHETYRRKAQILIDLLSGDDAS